MDPRAPFPSQHRYDLAAGEQPNLVPIHILARQQLVGCTSKTHFVRCWDPVAEIAGAGQRADLKMAAVIPYLSYACASAGVLLLRFSISRNTSSPLLAFA
jgi:hypothetical protein